MQNFHFRINEKLTTTKENYVHVHFSGDAKNAAASLRSWHSYLNCRIKTVTFKGSQFRKVHNE